MTDMPTVEPTGVPKVYSGNRSRYRNSVEVRESGSTRTRPLDLRLDLFNDSPTGFEWGLRRLGSRAIGAGDPR